MNHRGRLAFEGWCLVLVSFVAACGDAQPALSVESDPVIGTWALNIAKSTFDAPTLLKSQTVTFDSTADGIRVSSETIALNGNVNRSSYTARYDGKRYPISGSPNADSVSFARLDARTVERFDTKGNTFVGSVTRVLSQDGKTLTVMNKPVGPQGRMVGSMLVYDRR